MSLPQTPPIVATSEPLLCGDFLGLRPTRFPHISSHIRHVGLDMIAGDQFSNGHQSRNLPHISGQTMPPGAVFDALEVSGSTRKAGSACNGMPALSFDDAHLVPQP